MPHPLTLLRSLADAGTVAILLGLGITAGADAQCLHPATPCPCCADGMCYPKRDTWGTHFTNWRPWPGDRVGVVPTPAEEAVEEVREQLPILVRPRPDQEDLRGPARPVRPVNPDVETNVNELPPANGQQPANGQPGAIGQPPADQEAPALDDAPADDDVFDLPGFGQQGALHPLPRIEDGPPSLPRGLSEALTAQASKGATPAGTVTATANASQPRATVSLGSRYVTPAASTSSIPLTNPAAKNVQKSMDQDLHQAIYYEASDAAVK